MDIRQQVGEVGTYQPMHERPGWVTGNLEGRPQPAQILGLQFLYHQHLNFRDFI